MEDGELSDSDCEQPQGGAAVSAGFTNPDQAVQSMIPDVALQSMRVFRKSDVPGLSSGSSSDDSDTDGAAIFTKKKKHGIQPGATTDKKFTNPLLESKQRGPTGLGKSSWTARNVKAPKVKPHPKYVDLDGGGTIHSTRRKDMWGSVIQEQFLEREINKFGVEPADLSVLEYRDVEAYQIPKRSQISYDDFNDPSGDDELKDGVSKEKVEIKMEEEEDDDKEAKEQESLFEMETFGTDKKKELPKLSIKDRLGRVPGADSDSDDATQAYFKRTFVKSVPENLDFDKELERYKLKRKRSAAKSKKKHVKDRLGKKQHRQKVPEDYISVTENDSKAVIVNALVTNLQEPKVGLMNRVVEVLGAKKAITMMNETATIESSGGLMIADGSRRRTPGGVFLFLMRNDRHIRKDEIDLVFQEEREHDLRERRKVLKARRAHIASTGANAVKLPQDAYTKSKKIPKKPQAPDRMEGEVTEPMADTVEMEDGEVEDDDFGLEPNLEVQLD